MRTTDCGLRIAEKFLFYNYNICTTRVYIMLSSVKLVTTVVYLKLYSGQKLGFGVQADFYVIIDKYKSPVIVGVQHVD